MIEFFISGIPKGQPRHRARAWKDKQTGKWRARTYDSDIADDWKSLVALFSKRHRPAGPIDGPVRVDITFVFPRPKYMRAPKYPAGRIPHTAKPDRDNCEKAVLDVLTQIGFWRDDAQVCSGEVSKQYQAKSQDRCGAHIRIEPVHPCGAELQIKINGAYLDQPCPPALPQDQLGPEPIFHCLAR